jgi:aspartate ammonia-lyase
MVNTIKQLPLFADTTETEAKQLEHIAVVKELEKGDYLFHQGEVRTAFYIIVEGRIDIVRSKASSVKPIIQIDAHNFVSENAILDDRPHGSSAIANIPTKLLQFDKVKLQDLFKQNPLLAGKIYPELARSLANRLYKMNTKTSELQTRSYSEKYRDEHDLLGDLRIEDSVYYGIQTHRALENFNISGISLSHFPQFIKGLALVKKACAHANHELGYLDQKVTNAISQAADEIENGEFLDDFVVDMIQGGAGTSTNMNINEVLANRASEILGHKRGSYVVHPNNHVNLSQSTNDAYPSAIRLTLMLNIHPLLNAMDALQAAFADKGVEFSQVIKMGRTQLQDAVPMTLGQEFTAYSATIREDIDRLKEATNLFREINLGGTAIGTGINADPEFGQRATEILAKLTKIDLALAPNLIEATPDMGAFVMFSSVLKRIAVKISKICNDLRLLSSGPRAGLNEINLPPMQPGSSIMPGKVNPVIPEVVNQVAFQVIGNDLTVTMASEAGQLQLNVMEPIIVFNIFQSMKILENALRTLTNRCVKGITANIDVCRSHVEGSISIITALNPYIGYENSTSISTEALKTGKKVADIVIERGLLTREEVTSILSPENMTTPKAFNHIK